MGKVTSLQGKATGKVGSMVYSVSGGQMIAREYQPHVANPSTVAQTNQRASFKLLSQVAAALAPVIVIPKEGLKSSRNLFIKRNSSSVTSNDGIAQLTYENLQLTNGNAGLPAIEATRAAETGISIHLAERCDAAVTRVVYILYKKTSEQTLQYVQSIIVEAAGAEGKFPGTLYYVEGDICLFAYGMKDLNAKASAKYYNYNVANGEDIASLVLRRNLSLSDYQFTQTRGTTMFAGEDSTVVVPEGSARIFLTASGPGSVSGAGIFEIGSQVTVTATPNAGARFVGWKPNGDENIVSTNASYTFTLQGQEDLIAMFEEIPAGQQYTITVSYDSLKGSVTPNTAQVVNSGESVTFTASADPGYHFTAWKKQGASTNLSTSAEYTFTPNESFTLVAQFDEDI